MRISDFRAALLVLPIVLAGCEAKTDRATLAKAEAEQGASADEDGRILCARTGETTLARVCTIDREASAKGLVLTVRHPDGAFRRLLVTKDGRGVIAADGSQKALVTIVGQDQIEVALGGDRYRLPATVRGPATAAK